MSEIRLGELMYLMHVYDDEMGLRGYDRKRFFELGNEYTGAGLKDNGVSCVKRMYFKVKGYKL